ncbi:MAG: hypothetical protein ACFCUI_00050 [Bernardetiaceae bacterium]
MSAPKSTFEFLQQEVEAWAELFKQSSQNARQHFDNQREQIAQQITATTQRMEEQGVISQEQREKFRQRWEHLQVQFALGKAEGKEAYEAYLKKLNQAAHDFKEETAKIEAQIAGNTEKYSEELTKEFGRVRGRVEALQAQAALNQAEWSEEAEKRRQEITQRVEDFKEQIKTKRIENEARMDSFTKEMTASWEHIKKAFEQLLKG